jgi:hypothetical protein
MTDGQSARLSWNKAPIWGLRQHFYYCQTVAGFLMWGSISDERTGLSFTNAAGPRKRTHSRVRVLVISPLCTDRVENTVSNSTSIVAFIYVAAGTYLPSRFLAAIIYSCLLRSVA